jgi:carbon monoxide dehydrogenase subunit G
MFTVEAGTFINRTPQEVFDFVSDPANHAKWQSGVESAEWTSAGPSGAGSTQRQVSRTLGLDVASTVEIVTWDPPNGYTLRSLAGPLAVEGGTRLEARDGGTQITTTAQVEAKGLFKLAEPLFKRQTSKAFEESFVTLKSLLENGS